MFSLVNEMVFTSFAKKISTASLVVELESRGINLPLKVLLVDGCGRGSNLARLVLLKKT